MQEIIFLFLVKAPKGIRQDNTTNITVFVALFLNMFLLKIRHFKQVLSETGVGETGRRGGVGVSHQTVLGTFDMCLHRLYFSSV